MDDNLPSILSDLHSTSFELLIISPRKGCTNFGLWQEQYKEPSDDDDQSVKTARQLLTEVNMLELRTQ